MTDGIKPIQNSRLRKETQQLISTLSPQEQVIVRAVMAAKPRLKFPSNPLASLRDPEHWKRLGRYYEAQIRLAAANLKLPFEFVATYHDVALSKMRHPNKRLGVELEGLYSKIYEEVQAQFPDSSLSLPAAPELILPAPIQSIRNLTPELIDRLKREGTDFNQIDPYVFEHLVAELLAGQGFTNVRLVGRNKETSADIFAVKLVPEIGDEHRYYVEVKRYKHKVGVNVIDNVPLKALAA